MKKVTKAQVKATVKRTGSWTGYIAPSKVPKQNVNQGWSIGRLTMVTILEDTLMVDNNAYTLEYLLMHLSANNSRNGLGDGIAYWEE
ncbi:hypothetical protein P9X10_02370 [Bacillus cereus]|nr:hypothetical protein [Bacillus cereus]